MYFWVTFWKWLFILSLIGFGILTAWVIVGGIGDIQSLLSNVKEQHRDDDGDNVK